MDFFKRTGAGPEAAGTIGHHTARPGELPPGAHVLNIKKPESL
ncbi:hypothetical protein SAMN02745823_01200 [Sporobacter termitidis DSM 10068]|uniref:Uncharacterized protein n=1 Tax=Sporobacter termitidis DSM 10068 TaxID=1123282 RepID=A0A1M5WCX7_9FIRM|nr:hypothetical protein [Sporobacter termitidis]SHH85331.1 hypothetical protein SAMN02745823_01200 [Sporobacter termitidis DSM 10068]